MSDKWYLKPDTRSSTRHYSSEVLIEQLADGLFGCGPDDLLLDLTAFEKEKGWDASDVVAAGDREVFVHVKLSNLGPAGIRLSNCIDSRRHHPAGCAPRRPEIH